MRALLFTLAALAVGTPLAPTFTVRESPRLDPPLAGRSGRGIPYGADRRASSPGGKARKRWKRRRRGGR